MIGDIGHWAADAMGGQQLLAATALLYGCAAIAGGFVDNIPDTAATVPIVTELVNAAGKGSSSPLWWAFIFGADPGGNTTAVPTNDMSSVHCRSRNGTEFGAGSGGQRNTSAGACDGD